MGIKITEAMPEPTVPKAQTVSIGTIAEGRIEPYLRSDSSLWWHASIKPLHTRVLCHLIQGHGPTPAAAVEAALRNEERELAERAEFLRAAMLESGLHETVRNNAAGGAQ